MNIPVTSISLPLWEQHQVTLSVVRLDQTHPQISGNKWFKLQPALQQARQSSCSRLLSFGGPFSNHLHALAYAGYLEGFQTLAIIRGEPVYPLNPTLQDMQYWGMQLHFVSRREYAQRFQPDYIDQLRQRFGDFQLIPEGGSTAEAVVACSHIWKALPEHFTPDYMGCALGTGATAAGLVARRPTATRLLVVPALKITENEAWQMLQQLTPDRDLSLLPGFQVFAGDLPYARISPMLAALWQRLSTCYGVDLDPIYTLRVYHRMSCLLRQGYFEPGSHVALLHTGGMQGLRGCRQKIEQGAAAYNGALLL